MPGGYLSLKETKSRAIRTNTVVKIDIAGKTRFYPETGGRQTLALYLNLDLPPGGSAARKAMSRGGVRCWFQEVGSPVDETGLDGPWPLPLFGEQRALISHVWPHTVSLGKPWEFCFQVYAFDLNGKRASHGLTLSTRQVKIINDRA